MWNEFRRDIRILFAARSFESLVIESANCAKLVVALSAPCERGRDGRRDRDYKSSVLGNVYDFALSHTREVYTLSLSSTFKIARSVRPWDRDTAYRVRHSIRAHSRRLCIYVARPHSHARHSRSPSLALSLAVPSPSSAVTPRAVDSA